MERYWGHPKSSAMSNPPGCKVWPCPWSAGEHEWGCPHQCTVVLWVTTGCTCKAWLMQVELVWQLPSRHLPSCLARSETLTNVGREAKAGKPGQMANGPGPHPVAAEAHLEARLETRILSFSGKWEVLVVSAPWGHLAVSISLWVTPSSQKRLSYQPPPIFGRVRNKDKWQVLLIGVKHRQIDCKSQTKMLILVSSKNAYVFKWQFAWEVCTKSGGKPCLSNKLISLRMGGVPMKHEN